MSTSGELKQKKYHRKYYKVSSVEVYMFTAEDLPARGPNGQSSRARLYRSTDDGASWHEIPLRLSWRSWPTAKLCTSWPPEAIDAVEVSKRDLTITFHDPESEYERSPLPFGLGDESLWSATYLSNSATWTLARIRRLDYDGKDQHYRLETPYYYE